MVISMSQEVFEGHNAYFVPALNLMRHGVHQVGVCARARRRACACLRACVRARECDTGGEGVGG